MDYHYKKFAYFFTLLLLLLFIPIGVHAQTLSKPYIENSGIISNKNLYNKSSNYIYKEKKNLYNASLESCNTLTELQSSLMNHMYNKDSSFTINYKGNFSTLENDINNILSDIEKTDDYLSLSYSYVKWNAKGYEANLNVLTFNFDYLATKEQETYVNEKVTSILSKLLKASMNDDDKEKVIHDYIVKNVTYDENYGHYSAYNALYNGSAVCQGYALLAYKMLKGAGLNTKIVTGSANGESHAWNLVNIRNKWYHVDFTWDDPLPDIGGVSYDYYNINDVQMSVDHTWIKTNYPQANSTYMYSSDSSTIKHVTSIKINSQNLNLTVGQSSTLKATILPENADNKNISWYSSDDKIALVDSAGNLKAISEGNVVITAKSEDGNLIDLCKVTVKKDFNNYKYWQEKNSSNLNKTWTITFNDIIDRSSIDNNNIYVFDDTTQSKVDINIKVSSDKIILTPNRNYSSGHYYYLVVEKSVSSIDGKQMSYPTAMKFRISI